MKILFDKSCRVDISSICYLMFLFHFFSFSVEDDDIRIAQGTAVSYRITDERIKLFENDEESRIIELPKSDSEDENCVELVSIRTTRREIQIKHHRRHQEKLKAEENRKALLEKLEREFKEKTEKYFKQANDTATDEHSQMQPTIIKGAKNTSTNSFVPNFKSNEIKSHVDSKPLYVALNDTVQKTKIISIEMPEVERMESNDSEEDVQDDVSESMDVQELSDSSVPEEQKLEENIPEQEVEEENNESNIDSDEAIPNEIERINNRNKNLSKDELIRMKPKFYNSTNSRHVLLLLRNIIYFHGNLHVKLIAGDAQVFGYQLQKGKTVTVHSTRGHSLIYLVPTPKNSNRIKMSDFSMLHDFKSDFLSQDIDNIIEEFNENIDAILLLERDSTDKGVNMIDRYMRETMFPNTNAFNNQSPFYSTEFILHCQFSFKPRTGLVLSDHWKLVQLRENTRLVSIGGKGVGKSTFMRFTINSNFETFKKFVFIDLDIGQPELFVPQTISATLITEPILGPGYLKNIQPTKAILFGGINVLLNPIKYLQCVIELHKFCLSHKKFQNIPWIINTMGYNRGIGIELMAAILRIFQPTDVIQIQSENKSDNFDVIMKDEVINSFKFHIFNNEMKNIYENCQFKTHVFKTLKSRQKQIDLLPKDIRYAMIISKLGNCLKNNSDWLTDVKPFE